MFIGWHGLSLVVVCEGYSSLGCVDFSLQCLLLLQHTGSTVVAYGLSCFRHVGSSQTRGFNPRALHWQVDSYPLYYQ